MIEGRYPRTVEHDGVAYQFRPMTAADADAVLDFAGTVPRHDLLFLRRDITQPKVLAAWAKELEAGHIDSLLALQDNTVVGCSAVVCDPHGYSAHVGDLRVLLAPATRAHGLGRALIQESFLVALSLGLEKLTAQMTADQEAAVVVFQDMGFRLEAQLRNHVKDHAGNAHDLLVLSHDIAAVANRLALYGVDEALG